MLGVLQKFCVFVVVIIVVCLRACIRGSLVIFFGVGTIFLVGIGIRYSGLQIW